MQNLGVLGQGFVGSAIRLGMEHCFKVFAYDKDPQKYRNVNSVKELVEKSEITFVCVPTPMKKDGSCDLKIVRSALEEIQNCTTQKYVVVIKSTIPPGTTEQLNKEFKNLEIVFNPEFLTEANFLEDYKNQNRIILGGEREGTTKVKQVFDKAFPKVPIIKTSSTIAETIKYVTNAFLALKVSYANEIYQICKALQIDYDKVIEYAKYDERLGYSHWSVPGPDGDFGFGGHCLVKDLAALTHVAKKLGIDPVILEAAETKNASVRTVEDWKKQIGRAVSDE